MIINTQNSESSEASNGQVNATDSELLSKTPMDKAAIAPPMLTSRVLNPTPTAIDQRSGKALFSQFGWFNWANLSLRTKATVLAIALGTLPTLAIGSIGYSVQSNFVRQEVTKFHQTKATDAVDKLTRFIFERYGDIQVLANLPILRDPKLSTAVSLSAKRTSFEPICRSLPSL